MADGSYALGWSATMAANLSWLVAYPCRLRSRRYVGRRFRPICRLRPVRSCRATSPMRPAAMPVPLVLGAFGSQRAPLISPVSGGGGYPTTTGSSCSQPPRRRPPRRSSREHRKGDAIALLSRHPACGSTLRISPHPGQEAADANLWAGVRTISSRSADPGASFYELDRSLSFSCCDCEGAFYCLIRPPRSITRN